MKDFAYPNYGTSGGRRRREDLSKLFFQSKTTRGKPTKKDRPRLSHGVSKKI